MVVDVLEAGTNGNVVTGDSVDTVGAVEGCATGVEPATGDEVVEFPVAVLVGKTVVGPPTAVPDEPAIVEATVVAEAPRIVEPPSVVSGLLPAVPGMRTGTVTVTITVSGTGPVPGTCTTMICGGRVDGGA
jgi:hypothetical protein